MQKAECLDCREFTNLKFILMTLLEAWVKYVTWWVKTELPLK